jgi:hypothetical protein
MAKPISPVDFEILVKDSKIPLTLISVDNVKLDPMDADVFAGFKNHIVGFNQVPAKEHGRLFTHCKLSNIGFVAKNGLSYVPVFMFVHENELFDSELYSEKSCDGLPIVVLYHGVDNASYGRRFKSEFEANSFIKNGFKNGFDNISGKLEFYNS